MCDKESGKAFRPKGSIKPSFKTDVFKQTETEHWEDAVAVPYVSWSLWTSVVVTYAQLRVVTLPFHLLGQSATVLVVSLSQDRPLELSAGTATQLPSSILISSFHWSFHCDCLKLSERAIITSLHHHRRRRRRRPHQRGSVIMEKRNSWNTTALRNWRSIWIW